MLAQEGLKGLISSRGSNHAAKCYQHNQKKKLFELTGNHCVESDYCGHKLALLNGLLLRLCFSLHRIIEYSLCTDRWEGKVWTVSEHNEYRCCYTGHMGLLNDLMSMKTKWIIRYSLHSQHIPTRLNTIVFDRVYATLKLIWQHIISLLLLLIIIVSSSSNRSSIRKGWEIFFVLKFVRSKSEELLLLSFQNFPLSIFD